MIPRKILFVCIHNSARSQMAEAFLNEMGKGGFIAESAGLEPGTLNKRVVRVMHESGIDISGKGTQGVFDLLKQGKQYDAVITVCDGAAAERCPIFPGNTKRLAWSFADPSSFVGDEENVLARTREVRDDIKMHVAAFIDEASNFNYWIN